jgi:hypothetical protein
MRKLLIGTALSALAVAAVFAPTIVTPLDVKHALADRVAQLLDPTPMGPPSEFVPVPKPDPRKVSPELSFDERWSAVKEAEALKHPQLHQWFVDKGLLAPDAPVVAKGQ